MTDELEDDAPDAEVIPIAAARSKRTPRYLWVEKLFRARGKEDGPFAAVLANAVTILAHHHEWAGVFVYDELEAEAVTTRVPPWHEEEASAKCKPGPWTDTDDARLVVWIARRFGGLSLSCAMVREAVDVVARKNSVHPIREYLSALTWDGVPRLDTWLTVYLGVALTPYSRAVGRMFLISACARAFEPGCKVDTMPILEGAQGAFKSTAVRTLFGAPYVSDTPIDFESKDRFEALRGRWCIEMAELDGLDRSDINRVKTYLSSPCDDYRRAYARSPSRAPRQCVFFGTVNGSDYLRDPTGGRRFWPLRVGTIDIPALARDRDQLWAEARCAYEDGRAWWPSAELYEDFKAQQTGRTRYDEWSVKIEPIVARQDFVTVGEVLERAFGLDPKQWDQTSQNRVAGVLTALGWTRGQQRAGGRGSARRRGYWAPGKEEVPEDAETTLAPLEPPAPEPAPTRTLLPPMHTEEDDDRPF